MSPFLGFVCIGRGRCAVDDAAAAGLLSGDAVEHLAGFVLLALSLRR
jgi:hypothetical protein